MVKLRAGLVSDVLQVAKDVVVDMFVLGFQSLHVLEDERLGVNRLNAREDPKEDFATAILQSSLQSLRGEGLAWRPRCVEVDGG